MGGNKAGGVKSLETRLKKYGTDHQAKIGALGGFKSKGRKLSRATKRKISESQKRRQQNARENK